MKTAMILGLAMIVPALAGAQAPQAGGAATAPSAGSPAAQAALRWVALVDAGDAAGSWTASGTLFQSRGDQAQWGQASMAVRQPLGTVSSRVLLDEKPMTALPGAPDGRYEVVRFATSFAQKRGATETVVLAEEGGSWKVDGYFIS